MVRGRRADFVLRGDFVILRRWVGSTPKNSFRIGREKKAVAVLPVWPHVGRGLV